ncbi:hypothetical protein BG005_008539 [Podila minutissima]|nr:hypothetical protein BG005_008539 [Podila minutissima]
MLPSALMGDNNTWLVLSRGLAYKYSIQDNKWQSAGAVPNMFPTQNRTLAGDINPETGVWYIPNGYNVASTGSSTIVSMMQLDVARNVASGITGANGPPNDLARFSAVWSKRLKQLLVFGGESAAPAGASGRTMSSTLYTFTPTTAIAGGAAGGAIVLVAIIALTIRRRRRQHHAPGQDDDGTFSPPGTGDNFSLISRPGNPYSNVKAELTAPDDQRHNIALSLGLSDEGVREDLVARIKSHIAKHGTSDSALRELLYEDERHSTESSRLASLSSAAEDDLSDSAAQVRVKRSSPRKKTAVSSARTASDSESAEDPLSEHRVQKFMEHVHEDLEGAKDLAHSLEHTLQRKYRSGKETLRRASKDLTSSVTEAIDGAVGHRHDPGHHGHHEESSWCSTTLRELKHRLGRNAGHYGFSACWTDAWKKIHDLRG